METAEGGLRERRRRETARDVSDAALDLFERLGVHGTTVDDIAAAAGISQRTFFRYYATKESALFGDDDGRDELIASVLQRLADGARLAPALEGAWLEQLRAFDDEPGGHAKALRVRTLVLAEPTLLARALSRDAEGADAMVTAVAAVDDTPPLITRGLIELIGTTTRVAFDEWARRAEGAAPGSVHATYVELRRALTGFASRFDEPA